MPSSPSETKPAQTYSEQRMKVAQQLLTNYEKSTVLQQNRCLSAQQKVIPLSHTQRIRFISALPKNLYVNVPEYWSSVKDPQEAMDAVWTFGEPLSSGELDAIERLFPKLEGSSQWFTAVTALYRYHRPIGRKCLCQLLASGGNGLDKYAALILASNHDSAALPAILSCFAKYPNDAELCYMLGSWRNRTVDDELLRQYLKSPEDYNLAVALAKQLDHRALMVMWKQWALLSGIDTPETSLHRSIPLGSALISLDPSNSQGILLSFRKILSQRSLEDNHNFQPQESPQSQKEIFSLAMKDEQKSKLINVVGYLKIKAFQPELLAIIAKTLISLKKTNSSTTIVEENLAADSSQSLCLMQDRDALPLILQTKDKLLKNSPNWPLQEIRLALYDWSSAFLNNADRDAVRPYEGPPNTLVVPFSLRPACRSVGISGTL